MRTHKYDISLWIDICFATHTYAYRLPHIFIHQHIHICRFLLGSIIAQAELKQVPVGLNHRSDMKNHQLRRGRRIWFEDEFPELFGDSPTFMHRESPVCFGLSDWAATQVGEAASQRTHLSDSYLAFRTRLISDLAVVSTPLIV